MEPNQKGEGEGNLGRTIGVVLLVAAIGAVLVLGREGPQRMRLELVSRTATAEPAVAVALDEGRGSLYVAAAYSVSEYVPTESGEWQALPGSTVRVPGEVVTLGCDGQCLYVGAEGGVYAIDAALRSIAASYAGPFRAEGVCVRDDYVYAVLNWHEGPQMCGLYVLGASDLAQVGALVEPVIIDFPGTAELTLRDVAVVMPYAYVAADSSYGPGEDVGVLGVVDVSDPAQPTPSGSCPLEQVFPVHGVAVAGTMAYVGGNGLTVVDVSDASAPLAVGHLRTATELSALVAAPPFVYGAGRDGKVLAIDISVPNKPQVEASYDTGHAAYDLVLSEGHLYVADGDGGLVVLRIVRP